MKGDFSNKHSHELGHDTVASIIFKQKWLQSGT